MNSETPNSPDDAGVPALRFIPFRRADLRQMLARDVLLDDEHRSQFERSAAVIETSFAREFHELRQTLKDAFAPLDPDADTRFVQTTASAEERELASLLEELLDRANYEQLTERDLRRAFRHASLFQLRLKVDLDEFEEVVLYCRGASQREEKVPLFFGLWKRSLRFVNYDRVVLFLRFPASGEDELAGRVMLKLFQNVPEADLEMLFPNTQVAMRWTDRFLIGVPAVASGAVVATTKLGAPLILLSALVGFWLGLSPEPVELDKRGLLILAAGIAALGGYLWKQWSSYRNRKARFRQALTRSLYFKLLDNNTGVLLRILDDAEESECKESLLALYFLLAAGGSASAADIDARIEGWFADNWQARLDFEIEDALGKLERLGLARPDDGVWRLVGEQAPI